MTHILGISGSLRRDSFNSAALRAAQDLAPTDMHIAVADLSRIPLYDQDLFDQKIPTAVEHLSRQIAEADGLLFATPVVHIEFGVKKSTSCLSCR